MRKRFGIAVAVMAFLVSMAPAAALGKTVFVSKSGADSSGCGTTQGTACGTITGALDPGDGNAVDGDTVSVGAGTFTEQVTITKGITLDGAGIGSTTIQSPAHPMSANCGPGNEAVVCVEIPTADTGAAATIENLTVDASSTSGSDGGCGDGVEDIYAVNSQVTVQNTDDEHARLIPRSSLGGCQAGLGVTVENNDSGARTATISDNTVNDYQKNGITATGAGLTVSITGNTVTDQPASDIGPNGIQVGNTNGGTISGNTVTGNECNDTAGGCEVSDPVTGVQSAGILLYNNGPVTVASNDVGQNDIGIFAGDCSATQGCTYTGPSTVTVTGNTLTGNRYEGLFAGAGTVNASDNTISGSNIGVANVSFNNAGFLDPGNAILNLTDNSITGNGTALEEEVDQAGSNNPQTTAHDNAMTGNGNGIADSANQPVDASNNLLTCSAGSGSACVSGTGVTVSSLTLKVSPAATQIPIPNQTTTVTAELVDSSGNVVSGAAVPDGTSFGFATSLGSIPASATTHNGVATATLTSGSTDGNAVVAAAYQDQAATTNVQMGSAGVTQASSPTVVTVTKTQTVTKTVTRTLPLIVTTPVVTATKSGVVSLVAVNPSTSRLPVVVSLSWKQHHKTQTIAKRTATIRALKSVVLRLKLSKAALKALRKSHRLKVTQTATASGASASSPLTVRL